MPTTRAPAASARSTIPVPMPRLVPVTATTFPASSVMSAPRSSSSSPHGRHGNGDAGALDELGQLAELDQLAAAGRLDGVLVHRHVLGARDDEVVDSADAQRLA